ncbi:MAG: hypothetical protein A2287_08065 [Candidatus Melainabacteria bacterium RIFOXYA12_FULL_32_12]|nr:MAG: hypothetical protein A2255_08265 [Candidatus Melainabacteria bacterium RIFOXYA2_FULL_32_9]OGI27532.1 MAG: hypothetical protein A2287_08065 [Candidatus Melainabacteria bacterium RIFOXYA12_FULL_32_12]
MKNIELLAPAKDLECGIAAIKCGADAVYIGANKFGARNTVGNSLEDIEKLIIFAHKYWAKVYITINTILNDNELLEAEKLINKLYQIGADAIIIQDMGLLELDLPPIPLFASTQTHNNNYKKVEFLEKVGFQRVILARELSLQDIKEIKSKTNIDLECFIHGALCVSYSGQCYLSYAIGGRSGNKGECAQPCRKLYSLIDSSENVIAKDKYLLSLKDLNLSEYIQGLIEAGITSFKIEGRLKDINYIKNVVSFYRQEIDKSLLKLDIHRSSSGKSIINFEPDPYKSFNRGFTNYFLNGRNKHITSFDTPKSLGEPVGKVISIDKTSFTINTKIKFNNGDGICFFDENNVLQGTNINKIENDHIYPNDIKFIKKGTFIYRNFNHDFIKKLESAHIERKISVQLRFFEENNKLMLHIIDENGIEAHQEIEIKKEIANNKEMALNNIQKQLLKLGETEFVCSEITIDLKNIYFVPIKTLNELRRNIIDQLRLNRIEKYPREIHKIERNNFPYMEKNLNYEANILNDSAKNFYQRHGAEKISLAAESGIDLNGKKVMTTKHCLKYQLDLCPKESHKAKIKEPLYLIDNHNKNYTLNFDCKNCEMEVLF